MTRRASADDIDALVALDRACFRRAWSADAWRGELALTHGEGLVLIAGTPALAYASAPMQLGRCELRRIAVLPAARQRGRGRDLLDCVLAHAREAGCERVELEVAAANLAALALYQSAGFELVGRRPNYYRDPPDDALLLNLELSPRTRGGPGNDR